MSKQASSQKTFGIRQAIPPAIVGAIVILVLVLLSVNATLQITTSLQQAISAGQQLDLESIGLWMFIGYAVFIVLTFAAGGFTAAYISTKDAAQRFDVSTAAGGLAGSLAIVALLPFIMFITPEVALEVAAGLIAFTGLATLGGIASAMLLGRGESQLWEVVRRTVHDIMRRPSVLAPALVFMALMAATDIALAALNPGDYAMLAAGFFIPLVMYSFAITGVVEGTRPGIGIKAALTRAVTQSKRVLLGFAVLAVAMAALAIIAYLILSASGDGLLALLFTVTDTGLGLTAPGALATSALMTAAIIIVMTLSFFPQLALADGRSTLGSLKGSLAFVRRNISGTYSFYALIAAFAVVAQLAILAIDLLVITVSTFAFDVTMAAPAIDVVTLSVMLAVIVAAQTHYYSLGKKA
jgi:hypothetical protein